MSEYTVAPEFKAAMFEVARKLYGDEVQVVMGHPGQALADDVVSFGELSSSQEFGPMGPQRSRDETLTLSVVYSIFRRGGGDQERVTVDRAYELLGQLENYVRKTDTTLGGLVRSCFLTEHASDGSTDPDVLAAGRLTTVVARFTAVARITTGG